ncbi:MAG: hypothetical protein ACLT47_08705 [Sutterella wadsworthensis]
MEWTGINNENEYYSAYFLSEGLADSLKDQFDAWAKLESENKAKAEDAGEKDWQHAPNRALRMNARALLDELNDAFAETSDEEQRLQGWRSAAAAIGRCLELDIKKTPEAAFVNGDDHMPLPLLCALHREGKAAEPYLWVFEALPDGRSVDFDDELDPLEMHVSRSQFEDLPGFNSKVTAEFEDNWNKILEKHVFGCDNPPRWVILASPRSWLLIDRTKFARHSLLRFDWKELFSRREDRVLSLAAALLAKSSMENRNGTVLLDRIDEDAHKQAYGVSESLKLSLRRAIELLGNEAATQIIEKARRDKKTVRRDETFANDLTVECLRYMYRILFLLFVEARPDLAYAPTENDAFQSGYSFESLRDLEQKPLLTEEDRKGRYFHDSISMLVSFYSQGTPFCSEDDTHQALEFGAATTDATFEIRPLKGSLFDMERTPNLNKVVFTNETLQQVIRLMSLSSVGKGRRQNCGRISYAHLGIHQLGAVYEALLSYRGFFAQEDLYEVSADPSKSDEFEAGYFVTKEEIDSDHYKDEQKVYETNEFGEKKLKVYPKETFIYRLTGREREKSASYYTPEILTQCLVKYVLKEYWETVIDKLPTEKEKAERILKLRVAEPALGSATFLNEAVNQLAVKYMEHAQKARDERLSQEDYNRELQKVKMYLADNNVYGVDLNPVAVELAQVSLWLNALSSDKFVPWFGLQLHSGNSIIGCGKRVCKVDYEKGGKKIRISAAHELSGTRGEDEIWQFLLPDFEMATYKDADFKKVYKTQIDTLNKKVKAFNKALSGNELEILQGLSAMVDEHWDRWAEDLAKIRLSTTDPYAIYGHAASERTVLSYQEKNELAAKIRMGDGSYETGSFSRLRTAMNYWCSLWFWPIEEADSFPTRAEYIADMMLILSSEFIGVEKAAGRQITLNLDDSLEAEVSRFAEDDKGNLVESELDANPRIRISRQVSERLRFFHWPLRFADILYKTSDGSELGFDITLGNPPWRVPAWNSGAVVGDYLPYILFNKESASNIRELLLSTVDDDVRFIDAHPELGESWRREYIEAAGTQNFCGSSSNYPELESCRMDLFKVFLPLSWKNTSSEGVQGFVHPMTAFTETNASTLRKRAYEKARYIFQFTNEKKLFPEVHNETQFCEVIYEQQKGGTCTAIMNIFHPTTIDESFASDGDSAVEGIKDSLGNWNLKGHPDRIIHLDSTAIATFAQIFDSDPEAPILPNIHCQSMLSILEKFGAFPHRLNNISDELTISSMLNETTARVDGTIREFPSHRTKTPNKYSTLILNGPHLSVGSPLFKTPFVKCSTNKAWAPIDLEAIPDNFIPRSKYERGDISDEAYNNRQVGCKWDPVTISLKTDDDTKEQILEVARPFVQHWRIAYREMVGTDSERTLTSAIYPPGVSWINTINGIATKSINNLLVISTNFASLPFDALVRQLGKGHLLPALISSLPFVEYDQSTACAFVRILCLNCLTTPYAELWEQCFKAEWKDDQWTQNSAGLDCTWFKNLTPTWQRNNALRSDLSRRQALLEIDVLTAHAMKLTFKELLTLYRMRFRVMRSYEENTWYDQNGRIVFTTNVGLPGVGLPNKARSKDVAEGITYAINGQKCDERGLGFDNVKDMKSGTVSKTFPDTTMSDEPQERTVTYVAPFFKMDREKDYETAWRVFSERFGWEKDESIADNGEK